ncbi:hypothetical protein FQN55_004665 [Onygenales sp. PD_40]|nr:hypothetical protein FQN55_004665 [Onygenales sp. PD_40]
MAEHERMNESEESAISSAPDRSSVPRQGFGFICSICNRAFRRAENLKRHETAHSNDRQLQCPHVGCGKAFYRTDALQRHKKVHQSSGRAYGTRSSRACVSCSSARVKYVEDGGLSSTTTVPALRMGTDDALTGDADWNNSPRRPCSRSGDVVAIDSGMPVMISNILTSNPDEFDPVQPRGIHDRGLIDMVPQTSVNMNRLQRYPNTSALDEQYFAPTMLSSLNWLPPDFSMDNPDTGDLPMQFSPQLVPGMPIEVQTNLYPLGNITSSMEPDPTFPQYGESQAAYGTPSQSGSHETYHLSHQEHMSPSAGSDPPKSGYYVDGDGARLPRNGKRLKAKVPLSESSPFAGFSRHSDQHSRVIFEFPPLSYSESGDEETCQAQVQYLDEQLYQSLLILFHQTCVAPSLFPCFGSTYFPSLHAFNRLVQKYFQHFHPIFPLLHLPSFGGSNPHPLLALSLAAIGSHYVEIEGFEFGMIAMHEFLRRAIHLTDETLGISNADDTTIIITKLLNCIGLCYSGFNGFDRFARKTYGEVVDAFYRINSRAKVTTVPSEIDWQAWVGDEMRVRIRAGIWLLDSMMAYHFQQSPRISWETDMLLPSEEFVWETPSPRAWRELPQNIIDNLSLHKVLQILFMEKRLPTQTGEFAKICLIHGLYRQLWQIGHSLQRPLLSWSPTAERIDSSAMTWRESLFRDPLYEKWRNASCDVIDVLHWRAMSIIASSGTENPTVHHLHFARIVLLTPYDHILRLALFMAGRDPSRREEDVRSDRQHIRQWATEDQYKARLAMIHAGVGFWHIRRYSTGAFYEATNVFLSTLAIWAYGSFSQQINRENHNGRESSPASSDSAMPTSIRLDRPTDDELVQLYVKDGASMKATITGIGNISGPKGPRRALQEGRKILGEMSHWGISLRYIRILSSLTNKYEV